MTISEKKGKRKAGIFKVNIETPLGPIKSSVTVETGPMRLAELAPSAFELTGILGQRAVEQERQKGRTVSCGPNCGACCRQMVPVAAPEAFFIYDLLQALNENIRRTFLQRFRSVVEFLERDEELVELLSDSYTSEDAYLMARTYFFRRITCPFLMEESCGIYPYRPAACREYSVTTPPEYCADPFSGKVERVPMPTPLSLPLAKTAARLTDLDVRLIPLAVVPVWVEKHMDIHRQTWPGLDLFRQFIENIGPRPPESK